MDTYRFAGYRLVEFSSASKGILRDIADRLIPHEQEILDEWIRLQWDAWQPPGLTRDDLAQVFGGLMRNIFGCMHSSQLELCISHLERAGADLAGRQFPFQALIISVHFFEESYMPFLVNPPSAATRQWLVAMDEFLHAALAAVATSYFEAYRKELLDQAEVGRVVQEGLLADIPKRAADLEIAHVYMSAREQAKLGGDFLDFFHTEPGGIAFIIGDLSGHGLEAVSDSLMLRSLFKGFMRENADLADAMQRLNRAAETDLRSDQFATALAVVYDMSGRLSLVSAGHPEPVLCEGEECRAVSISGLPLAVVGGAAYGLEQTDLRPGAVFVAYTDGLVEARRDGKLFGEQRVLDIVKAARHCSARSVAEQLVDEALRFAGGRFCDDVAVLVLKRRDGGSA